MGWLEGIGRGEAFSPLANFIQQSQELAIRDKRAEEQLAIQKAGEERQATQFKYTMEDLEAKKKQRNTLYPDTILFGPPDQMPETTKPLRDYAFKAGMLRDMKGDPLTDPSQPAFIRHPDLEEFQKVLHTNNELQQQVGEAHVRELQGMEQNLYQELAKARESGNEKKVQELMPRITDIQFQITKASTGLAQFTKEYIAAMAKAKFSNKGDLTSMDKVNTQIFLDKYNALRSQNVPDLQAKELARRAVGDLIRAEHPATPAAPPVTRWQRHSRTWTDESGKNWTQDYNFDNLTGSESRVGKPYTPKKTESLGEALAIAMGGGVPAQTGQQGGGTSPSPVATPPPAQTGGRKPSVAEVQRSAPKATEGWVDSSGRQVEKGASGARHVMINGNTFVEVRD